MNAVQKILSFLENYLLRRRNILYFECRLYLAFCQTFFSHTSKSLRTPLTLTTSKYPTHCSSAVYNDWQDNEKWREKCPQNSIFLINETFWESSLNSSEEWAEHSLNLGKGLSPEAQHDSHNLNLSVTCIKIYYAVYWVQ